VNHLTLWKNQELSKIKSDLDDLFADVCRSFGIDCRAVAGTQFRLLEQDDHLVLLADLPGLEPEFLDIGVTDDVLRLTGRIKRQAVSGRGTLVSEQHFEKTWRLPCAIDPATVTATYREGVLTVVMPKCRPKTYTRVRLTSD
jgi:HSP20 family protein